MHLGRVFRLRKWLIPVVLLGTFSRLYYAFFHGYAEFSGTRNLLLYRIFAALTLAPLLSVAILMGPPNNWLEFIPMVLWITFMCWFIFGTPTRSKTLQIRASFGGLGFSLAAFIGGWLRCTMKNDCTLIQQHMLWLSGLLIGFPLLLLLLAWTMHIFNVSMFSAGPLDLTIRTVLKSPLRIPLFVTTAHEVQ
jgi:hypothetical protein